VLPVGSLWPSEEAVEAERSLLMSSRRERRSAPRLPIPLALGAMTPLRDISATGLRYVVGPNERPPELGGSVEGAVQLDAETVIEVRGRVVRRMGREVAVALDPPGLEPEVMTILRRRFFPEGAARTS
jgi:PilZ domain